MRIYTKSGDLAFKTFTFPDGQPHFTLETYEREFASVTVEMALKNPVDVFLALIVSDVLRQHGYSEINLDVRYLMGARMDRAIDTSQPFTLATVARIINGAGFSKVRILDVHSDVATRLIRNSENILPSKILKHVCDTLGLIVPVCPDKGAIPRVESLMRSIWGQRSITYCYKERDMQTGNLTGFKVHNASSVQGAECLIIDDICDGGGTFVGLAKELRKAGAKKVHLFVTHGIFSKGLPLEGIDKIFTTNSYWFDNGLEENLAVTSIPISMKEMK